MATDSEQNHITADSAECRHPSAVEAWHGTVFTNAKAGMAGVDAEKVKQIVYQMSKVTSLAKTALNKLPYMQSSNI